MSSVINLNDLFGPDEEEQVENKEQDKVGTMEVELSQLVPFLNHPFKLYEGDRLNDMVESINEHGIITPLIVRPLDNGKYEILSGHNRSNAGKISGLEKAPVVIKEDLTDEEAMLIVTETNLIQRSFTELTHSEKARILTERHKVMKEQGRRKDISKDISPEKQRRINLINEIENLSKADSLEEKYSVGQIDPQRNIRDKIGNQYDLSPRAVSRYLRIDILINELKDRIDSNEIPFMAGIDLSFLNEKEQGIIESILETYGFKMDLKKSNILKSFSQGKSFSHDKAHEVLSGKFFNKPKKVKNFKLKPKLVSKFFKENQTQTEIEEVIENALELYFSKDHQNKEKVDLEQ